jgi:Kef-type K+ transport system membrane component KefB
VSASAVALILVKAVGFLVVALLLGIRFAPLLVRMVTRMRVRGSLIVAALAVCLSLTLLAVTGKLASGLAVYQRGVARWPIGVGMVPRGEVGLIFAGIGLANKVIDDQGYTALLAMVLISTLIVPPWLRVLFRGAA